MKEDHELREPIDRPAKATSRVATILMAIVVCYVLSAIPRAWVLERTGLVDRFEMILIIDAPLGYLAERLNSSPSSISGNSDCFTRKGLFQN